MPPTSIHEVVPASRLKNVHYAIRDLVVLADELTRQGRKILPLNIGDPPIFDFPTPAHMIEAVNKAMRDGYNGYAPSLGTDAARESIRRDAERKGIASIQSVFVTQGTGEAVDVCLTALLNPGDSVLVPRPDYPLYTAVLAKLDAPVRTYDLNESNGWEPDLDQLAASVDKSTRAIVVINPNNPTGAVYSRATLEAIAEIARRHNLVIFSDEIYDKLILDNDVRHISMAAVAPDIPVVTLGGLSKNYLVPGWRIGWGVLSGEPASVRNYCEGIYKLLRARLSASYPMQFAIPAALDGPQDHLQVATSKMRARRDLLVQWAGTTPRVSCVRPLAAFYGFPKLEIPDDDLAFVKGVLTEKNVLVVHGAGFGQKPGTRHIRIVYLPEERVLQEAFTRITDYIREKYS
jgi:alanine-synthesizing transaminase